MMNAKNEKNMTDVSGDSVTAINESNVTTISEDNVTDDLVHNCTVQNDPGHKRNVTTADTLMDLIR